MAAMKFFLYTLVGSLLMLVAILAVYFLASRPGARSFDYAAIYNALARRPTASSPPASRARRAQLRIAARRWRTTLQAYGPWMFLAFALAFAIKVPMFPVHTWLPDAHVQAPVAGLDDPRRRDAEDGHLRLLALRDPAVPGRGAADAGRRSRCWR